ncbi:MAG: cupredoxin domain-containing protein [Candidatus Levybacteria bacterium]|nr:cupredoxin domain-containing protein [Candidatus Levybacteria bacterium]
MDFADLIVLLSGIGGIGFISWFFFGKKAASNAVEAGNAITIQVSGGYTPATIQLQKGKKTAISFHRTDPSSCLEEVIIADFKIRKFLPLNERVDIELNPNKTGTFQFSCGMNMFHGKIIVK